MQGLFIIALLLVAIDSADIVNQQFVAVSITLIDLNQLSQKYIVENSSWSQCTTGAIQSKAINQAVVEIRNCTFTDCQLSSGSVSGGAIQLISSQGGKQIIEKCKLINCNSQRNAGGIDIIISDTNTLIEIIDITIQNCSAKEKGGAMYIDISSNALLLLKGSCLFENDTTLMTDGGGIWIIINQSSINYEIEGDLTFKNCTSSREGGAVYLTVVQSTCNFSVLGDLTFDNCTSGVGPSQGGGGALRITLRSQTAITLDGKVIFKDCYSHSHGGGISIEIRNTEFQLTINDLCIFKDCQSLYDGGGMELSCVDTSVKFNIFGEMNFEGCIGHRSVGAFYLTLSSGSQAEISNLYINNCSSLGYQDNAGAMEIYMSTNTKMVLKDIQAYNCYSAWNDGGIIIYSQYGGSVELTNISIVNCSSAHIGGGLRTDIQKNQIFKVKDSLLQNDSSASGGGFLGYIATGASIILEQTDIYKCSCIENGGGINIMIDGTELTYFTLIDVYIHECQATGSIIFESPPSGFGGGLFITNLNDYAAHWKGIDLRGMKIYGNYAKRKGQSVYVAMVGVVHLCKYGIAGEFVKGNYSDSDSYETDLEGIICNQTSFQALNIQQAEQGTQVLEYWWNDPRGTIFHILNRNGQYHGENVTGCAESTHPCLTIEYAIQQISIERGGGSETDPVQEKRIGIHQQGYDLAYPIQFSQSSCFTNVIKIMKQLYGTEYQMDGQAELKILNSANVELSKSGWISTATEMTLRMYGIKIIANAQLSIPVIYIEGSESIVELNTITFFGINLSPSSQQKGIVHLFVEKTQFVANHSTFQDINIIGAGGNAIRIQNSGAQGIQSTISDCNFINISSSGDANGIGGSALYFQSGSSIGDSVLIDGSSKFQQCKCSDGEGGAIYAKIEQNGQLEISGGIVFEQCESQQSASSQKGGRGGAIYADINFGSQVSFVIKDALFSKCKALSSSSTSSRGFGGGIFIAGTGDYDVQSNGLDFRGIKIDQNSADKEGLSIYIVMSKIKEFCQYGTAGGYVKGNYNDRTSYLDELVGIPLNINQFNQLQLSQVLDQQYHLQYYWSQIVTLTKALAVVNESDIDEPIKMKIDGQNMNNENFSIKIIDLGQKSSKQANLGLRSPFSNFIRLQPNHQLTKVTQTQYINQQELIYPPEDQSSNPISIQGQPQSQQSASFKINDLTFIDYNNIQYGVLASNERRIFTGIGGKEGKMMNLEIQIIQPEGIEKEEEEQKEEEEEEVIVEQVIVPAPKEGIPFWIIIVAGVGGLALLALLISLLTCCCLFLCCPLCRKKSSKEDRVKKIREDYEKIKIKHQKNEYSMQLASGKQQGFDINQNKKQGFTDLWALPEQQGSPNTDSLYIRREGNLSTSQYRNKSSPLLNNQASTSDISMSGYSDNLRGQMDDIERSNRSSRTPLNVSESQKRQQQLQNRSTTGYAKPSSRQGGNISANSIGRSRNPNNPNRPLSPGINQGRQDSRSPARTPQSSFKSSSSSHMTSPAPIKTPPLQMNNSVKLVEWN